MPSSLSYHPLSGQGLLPIELIHTMYIQVMVVVKSKPAKASNRGSIPGSGRSPREGNGNPLQYSCHKFHRGAWWATVCGVTKTQLTTHYLKRNHDRAPLLCYFSLTTALLFPSPNKQLLKSAFWNSGYLKEAKRSLQARNRGKRRAFLPRWAPQGPA